MQLSPRLSPPTDRHLEQERQVVARCVFQDDVTFQDLSAVDGDVELRSDRNVPDRAKSVVPAGKANAYVGPQFELDPSSDRGPLGGVNVD